MSSTAAPTDLIADALAGLPAGFLRLDLGHAVAVVGPTGVFLVAHGHDDPCRIATELATAARHVRSRIAERLAPAPFVEAIVVADHECPPSPRAAVVPPGLLVDAILDGAVALPEPDAAAAADALQHLRPTA